MDDGLIAKLRRINKPRTDLLELKEWSEKLSEALLRTHVLSCPIDPCPTCTLQHEYEQKYPWEPATPED